MLIGTWYERLPCQLTEEMNEVIHEDSHEDRLNEIELQALDPAVGR